MRFWLEKLNCVFFTREKTPENNFEITISYNTEIFMLRKDNLQYKRICKSFSTYRLEMKIFSNVANLNKNIIKYS